MDNNFEFNGYECQVQVPIGTLPFTSVETRLHLADQSKNKKNNLPLAHSVGYHRIDAKKKASGEESHTVTTSPTTISSLPTIDKSINLNPMTPQYNLNFNWVSPIITALSLSANPSLLNLNTELATTSSPPSSSTSSSSLLLSCMPQIATKLRASSCFSLGRSSHSSIPMSFHPQEMKLNTIATSTATNNDNNGDGDNDIDKPLDLSVKSLLTNQPTSEMNLPTENAKTSSRRKLSKPRSQAKTSLMTTTVSATTPATINTSGISHSPEQAVSIRAYKEPQIESIPSMNTDNKNGIELSQQWKLDIQNLVHLTETNQKRQKSTAVNRRPFKAFGNTIPSISKEILLKSTELIDPLLLASTIVNTSETVENTQQQQQQRVTLTPPTPITTTTANTNDIDNTVSSISKDHSRRKSTSKRKSRRSQSTSAIIPLDVNDTDSSKAFPSLSTTKSLESLSNKTDQCKEIITATPSIASISSTPSCYSSSYPELIDIKTTLPTVECNPRMRRFPEMTPKEIKDKAYWEKRVKNNEAARRSRRARKTKELSLKKYADNLEKVNMKLIEEIELLKAEIIQLKAEKEAQKSS
ncbi:unnamed protein product [Trichobilharzia regenti]|nr:unnamed protein product [Trichobilharzia regenti]